MKAERKIRYFFTKGLSSGELTLWRQQMEGEDSLKMMGDGTNRALAELLVLMADFLQDMPEDKVLYIDFEQGEL